MSNSIARASYWLVRLLKMLIKETLTKNQVGWELHRGGQLTRALDQVTSLQFCSCCHSFSKPRTRSTLWKRCDLRSSAPQSSSLWNGRWKDTWLQLLWWLIFNLCIHSDLHGSTDRESLGHSKVQLVFDAYKEPLFKIQAGIKPILGLDLGFAQNCLFIFYRDGSNQINCLYLKS